jgi:cell division septum initiation protein DivIVA
VGNNTAKDDVIALGGREFKRVKNGLDEAQVASFIDELISERDKLVQSQAHIASLTKLAEKTIVEADRMADQLKSEAAEQAKAESATIIDKAKEQAQQMAEEKLAEAVEIADEKARAIRAKAEKKAALLLENERKRIRDELSNTANQQWGYLLKELESLKQQAAAAQADFNNKLSQPREESSAATMKEGKALDKSLEPIQAGNQNDKIFEPSHLLPTEHHAELGKPQWEVEILPPVDIAKIMKVVAYLDQLPEVENTEIIPRIDRPSIVVFLRESINFVDVLGTIPEAAYVEEVTTDEDAADGEPKKVRIGLSENTTSQEKE